MWMIRRRQCPGRRKSRESLREVNKYVMVKVKDKKEKDQAYGKNDNYNDINYVKIILNFKKLV